MGICKEIQLDRFFYENWLSDMEKDPEWCEHLYGVPIEEVLKDPQKYYEIKIPIVETNEKLDMESKTKLQAEGLF